jgi:beta-fructofuranosidase
VHGATIRQTVCHATSTDCVAWTKDPANPVSRPEAGFGHQDWRDPFVFWNAGERCYWMLLSTRSRTGPATSRGAIALRTSADLMAWSETEVLQETLLAYCPECPEIFRLGEKWIMAYSRFTDRSGTVYLTADDPRGPWRAISPDRLDGPNWYAAKSLTDDDGRRIAFGWIPDRNPTPTPEFGSWLWAGDLAVPRELVLSGHDLGIRIPDEVQPDGLDITYAPTCGSDGWKSGPAGLFETAAAGHFDYCILDPDRQADEYVLSMSLSWAPGTAMVGVAVQASAQLDRGAAILCYPGENRVSAVDLGSPAPPSDDSGEPEQSAPDYAPIAEESWTRDPARTWLCGSSSDMTLSKRSSEKGHVCLTVCQPASRARSRC